MTWYQWFEIDSECSYPKDIHKHYKSGFSQVGEEESQWSDISQHSVGSNVLTLAMIFLETFKLLGILS